MRNVFDQYSQPENRVTHALVSALAEDPHLLLRFVRWITDQTAPSPKVLKIVEQSLPGEVESREDEDGESGLPDAWIFNEDGWCLLIESKISSRLTADQLRRHFKTALRRGFTDIHVLGLDVDKPRGKLPAGTVLRTWPEVFTWLKKESLRSDWADRAAEYFEVAERRLSDEQYLKEGTLTTFTGIPFGRENPYSYLEAKRLLKMAMGELRARKELKRELGVDPGSEGRESITGSQDSFVWDYLSLKQAADKPFTSYPHLTLVIHQARVLVITIIPHRIRTEYRRRLTDLGPDGFLDLIHQIEGGLRRRLKGEPGAVPICQVAASCSSLQNTSLDLSPWTWR